jgi:hypothetical protein
MDSVKYFVETGSIPNFFVLIAEDHFSGRHLGQHVSLCQVGPDAWVPTNHACSFINHIRLDFFKVFVFLLADWPGHDEKSL